MNNPQKRILIVDDNVEIGRFLHHLLLTAGYDVEYLSSSIRALEAMKKCKPDLLVTDIIMPQMDGVELIKQVQKLKDYPEILVMTGGEFLNGPDVKKCLDRSRRIGICHFLEKPFLPDDFISQVHGIFFPEQRRYRVVT